jgi:hypothetical protein
VEKIAPKSIGQKVVTQKFVANKKMEERVELLDLPVEAICHILFFVTEDFFALHELTLLKKVCKLFYDIVEEQLSYHTLELDPESFPETCLKHKCLTLINKRLYEAQPMTLVFVITNVREIPETVGLMDMLSKWYHFETNHNVILLKTSACAQLRGEAIWNCTPDSIVFKPNMLCMLLDDGTLSELEKQKFLEVYKKVRQLSGHVIVFICNSNNTHTPDYLKKLKNTIGCVI